MYTFIRHFTVIGSKSVNQNGKYSVAITSRNFDDSDPPILQVAIQSEYGVPKVQNITLINGESQSLEFDMEGPIVGDYVNLSINCIRGLDFNRIVKLNLTRNVSAFVQTDKAIYRPSDVVRFRVLILDENLRPLNSRDVRIFVIDSSQNTVKMFEDKVFEKGLFEGNVTLSDSPVLGNWSIVALVYDDIVDKKPFEVAEYTLPTFETIFDVKPHVSFAEGVVTSFLMTKYTFGKVAEVENRKFIKYLEVSGNTSVEFDIKKDLGLAEGNVDHTVKLFVTFIEEVTGKTQNASATVQVHSVPYKLQIKTKSDEFKPGLSYTIEAIVQHHDDNVLLTDNENQVTFKVTFVELTICNYIKRVGGSEKRKGRTSFYKVCSGGSSTVREFKVYPTNGTSKIDFRIPDDIVSLNLTVTYLNMETSKNEIPRASSEDDHFIVITSKTEIPKLKENVKINIQSTKHFAEFSYHVFSIQGRLIASETVPVNSTQNHDFEFTPTLDMESEIKIIVFYITDKGEIVFDSLRLEFDESKNFVDVQISDKSAHPNNLINIDIESNPNSLVGLLGIDQSALVLKGSIDFSDNIKGEDRSDVFFILHPGQKSFIPFSGINDRTGKPYYNEDKRDKKDSVESQGKKYRKSFPETWLFEIVNFDVNQTTAVISRNVPDTITTWMITAFSIHPTTGLAIIRRPVTLIVFKPLFMSMDLPYSIKRNEIVSIPISVFNYMEDDQEVHITMHNENAEFTFIERGNTKEELPSSYEARTKSLHVNKKSGSSTSFQIQANRIGSIKIRVSATSLSSLGDGIERNLLVKPEGITKYMDKVVFIDLSNSHKHTTNLNISIPREAVNGSIRIEASIIGDILGLSGNLRNLLRLPIGRSEQNMINFIPSIAVLDYLTVVNKLTPEVKSEATANLELVYQKQLNYRNDDGSFKVWGERNESGSNWLTAFVVKSFSQAKKYIFVDSVIIEKGLRFLAQTQLEDGSFEEVGYSFRKDVSSNRIALTAYILITFLENADYANTYNSTINKALSFIGQHFANITDNYSLAIAAYAVQLAPLENAQLRSISLSKLETASIKDGETMRWDGSLAELNEDASKNETNSLDIEATAYALQAFVRAGHLDKSLQITKWLVSQRNEYGGFISTQDTVVALQALSNVAAKMNSSDTDMDVTIKYGVDCLSTFEFNVNRRNASLLLTKNLPSAARDFRVTARGEGFSIFQISYQYNVDDVNEKDSSTATFKISHPVVNRTKDPKIFFLDICVSFILYNDSVTSNMADLEVKFPTGFKFLSDFSDELKESTDAIKGVRNR